MHRSIRSAPQVISQPLRQGSTYVAAARKHPAHRVFQLFRNALLRQVSGRAGFEGAPGILGFRVHTQKEYRHLWAQPLQVVQDVQPAPPRHADVQNHHLPVLAAHRLESLLCCFGLAESRTGKRFLDRFFEPPANECMIIGDQDSHLESRPGRLEGGHGIRKVMVVPAPDTPSTLSTPFSNKARSCIPTKPNDLRARGSWGSKPLPLSRTSSMRASPLASRRATTRVA